MLKIHTSLFVVSSLIIVLSLIFGPGCVLSDRGFRFTAGYEAVHSGYRIRLVSMGIVKPGDDLASTAFAVVNLCPTRSSIGRALQMTLTSQPKQWVKLDCESLNIRSEDLQWKTSENVLASMLKRSGYDSLVPEEIQGSLRVMLSSLNGPKGVILEGQIATVRVLDTKIDYGYDVNAMDPPAKWIAASEYPKCTPEK
jgi:hypothetical protein